MTPYNHITFMEEVASTLKDLLHTQKKKRFFISTGLMSMEGIMANLPTASLPCLIAEDNSEERLSDNISDNILSHPFYTFYILYPAPPGNDQKIMEARQNARITAKKVLSRMLNKKFDPELGLDMVDYNSIRILGVGPIADNAHGVMVTFTLVQPAEINYNPEDWNDGTTS
jgi:hypothetical protein